MSGPSQPSASFKPFLQPAGNGPTPSVFSGVSKPRRNIGQACDGCRQSKKKCNGARPVCGACIASQVECTYNTLDRRRVDARNQELDKLRADNDQMAATLQTLAHAPEHLSFAMLEDLRKRSGHFLPGRQDSTSARCSSDQCSLERYGRSESIPAGFALPSIVQMFAPSDLPPESEVRDAAACFFANTSALFHVMTFSELETLLDNTYRSGPHVDLLSLCEICSLASVGYQCLPGNNRLNIKHSLYRTATVHLRQCLEMDKVRTIRVLVCLACYDIVENREAARLSIAFGLHLARSELGYPASDQGLLRQIYRTLIFADCLLATSLGFPPNLEDLERQLISPSLKSVNRGHMSETEVQELAGTVALFKADILTDARGENSDISIIDKHMARLDKWYFGLPDEMRLAALLSEQSSPLSASQRRGMLFVHALFLGAIILLHRRILVSMAAAQLRDLTSRGFPEEFMIYSDRPVTAACHVAQIFRLVDYEKNIFQRCWLCISEIYSSSAVLLLIASCKLVRRDAAGSQELLSLAGPLIQMLSGTNAVDPATRRLYSLLQPLHARIDDLRKVAANTTLGPAETVSFHHVCRAAIQISINHLQSVFGDEACEDIVDDGRSEMRIPTWWA